MRKLILIIVQSVAVLFPSFAQPTIRKFGIETNQFIVQSGFGTSSELQLNISDSLGKRLSLGLYYDSKLKNIGGFSISILKMVGNYQKFNLPMIEPYLFYNLIYHKTNIDKQMVSENYFVAVGTYKSIEHHAGFGLRVNIITGCYLKGEIGYGFYLGSIMKPSKPDLVLNESYGTHGAGAMIKIGVGTFF